VLFKVRHPLFVVPFKLHCLFYIQFVYKIKWVICCANGKFCNIYSPKNDSIWRRRKKTI
jgi:hypothetical protein